jgi:hypothetical protein
MKLRIKRCRCLIRFNRPYAVLETEDFDHAIRALRNPVTLQIWLRNTALRMEIQPSADLYRGPEVRRL